MLSQNSCYQGYLLVENTSLDGFYHQIGINYMIAGPLLTFEGVGWGGWLAPGYLCSVLMVSSPPSNSCPLPGLLHGLRDHRPQTALMKTTELIYSVLFCTLFQTLTSWHAWILSAQLINAHDGDCVLFISLSKVVYKGINSAEESCPKQYGLTRPLLLRRGSVVAAQRSALTELRGPRVCMVSTRWVGGSAGREWERWERGRWNTEGSSPATRSVSKSGERDGAGGLWEVWGGRKVSTGWRPERWRGERVMVRQNGGLRTWQKHKPLSDNVP